MSSFTSTVPRWRHLAVAVAAVAGSATLINTQTALAAPGDGVAQISGGNKHSCAVDVDSVAYCWGADTGGMLGNGPAITTVQDKPYPVDMSGLPAGTTFASVAAGQVSACALTTEGAAYCWGSDSNGLLGNGAAITGNQSSPSAVDVSGLSEGFAFASLTLLSGHACGLSAAGDAYCWGYNGSGQLGDGTTTTADSPVAVDVSGLPAGTTWRSLDVGRDFTCGVTTAGAGYCWGDEGYQTRLGNGTVLTANQNRPSPLDMTNLPTGAVLTAVSAGQGHACAVTDAGAAYCWGLAISGQLGAGPMGAQASPVAVDMSVLPAGTMFGAIAGGGNHSCALDTAGAAYCWGNHSSGALGTGPSSGDFYRPRAVDTSGLPAGTAWRSLSAGFFHTCGVTTADEAYCWGADGDGRLGNGPTLTAAQFLPGAVLPMLPVEGLAPTISASTTTVTNAVGDPTNPGLTLTIADADSDVAELTMSAGVANESVIPAAGVTVAGTGAERTVSFEPVGQGFTSIGFTVSDPEGNTQSVSVQYAASSGMLDTETGRYYHHASDLSSALDVGDGHVIAIDDERNDFYVYDADRSGPPVKQISPAPSLLGTWEEIDFEGIARVGDTLVAFGSHGNSRNGPARPERRVAIAFQVTGSGANVELTPTGRYNNLWSELRVWDQSNGHGLGADALGFIAGTAPGVLPNAPAGFNIEGFEFAPDGTTGYLAFRAPTVEIDGEYHSLIVPVENIVDLFDGFPGSGPAEFGDPILVDLDGRSIRDIRRNEHNEYLISAGSSPQNPTWALYTWDGNPDNQPQFNRDLPGETGGWTGTWESIVSVPHPLVEGAAVRLIADDGHGSLYGSGENKDLSEPLRKSYAQDFALGPVTGTEPDAGDQDITVVVPEVTGPGEFVWAIDGDPNVVMTEAVNAGSYLHSTGEIAPITVTDTRIGGAEWSLSGQVSDFTGGLAGKHLGWTPEVVSPGAGATAGAAVESGITSGNGLADAATLASATAGHALGSGTVGADLDLRLPVDTAAGTYTATLTITALS